MSTHFQVMVYLKSTVKSLDNDRDLVHRSQELHKTELKEMSFKKMGTD